MNIRFRFECKNRERKKVSDIFRISLWKTHIFCFRKKLFSFSSNRDCPTPEIQGGFHLFVCKATSRRLNLQLSPNLNITPNNCLHLMREMSTCLTAPDLDQVLWLLKRARLHSWQSAGRLSNGSKLNCKKHNEFKPQALLISIFSHNFSPDRLILWWQYNHA